MDEIENKTKLEPYSSESSGESDVPEPILCKVVECKPHYFRAIEINNDSISSTLMGCSSAVSSPLNISWPSSWANRTHKSAFQPYRPGLYKTVLTNLQRGNTETESPKQESSELTWHEKAGHGVITSSDIPPDCKIDVFDSNGLTALMWASCYGQYKSVKLLLKAGASVNMTGLKGESPLLLSASKGHLEVLRLLISCGADVNVADKDGNTAIIYAALNDHHHCVRELLFSGADMTAKNKKGISAYRAATRKKNQLVVDAIQKYLLSMLDNFEPKDS